MQQELWSKETQANNEQEETAETGRKIYGLKIKNRMVI